MSNYLARPLPQLITYFAFPIFITIPGRHSYLSVIMYFGSKPLQQLCHIMNVPPLSRSHPLSRTFYIPLLPYGNHTSTTPGAALPIGLRIVFLTVGRQSHLVRKPPPMRMSLQRDRIHRCVAFALIIQTFPYTGRKSHTSAVADRSCGREHQSPPEREMKERN